MFTHVIHPTVKEVFFPFLKPRSCGTFGRSDKVKPSDLWTPYFPGDRSSTDHPNVDGSYLADLTNRRVGGLLACDLPTQSWGTFRAAANPPVT